MNMNNTQNKETALIIMFAIVVVTSTIDFVTDISSGAASGHIVRESIAGGISILAIAWLLLDLRQQKLEIKALKQELKTVNYSQNQPKEYVLEVRHKLGTVVTQQFSEWMLTGSETEVGWMLLKGLSLKEIAILRNTQEKTVRQQASSLYKKAGVSGRHAFSAWFIEGIL
ncbi:hypothetical protein MNBD_GAMMA13-1549 [hydrothermal vent metagenome]|uniref:HTH luxR-type domain-containing protein n=1 Tax=hydrothermal vent metagenome TaxID=652676 RepID=A0A3B0Y568_9ZZZZ